MPFLTCRSKRAVTRVVCLVVLLVISGAVLMRGISSQIPTGTWAPAGNGTQLAAPRAGAATVQLTDGRLLITGGDSGSGPVASADIYDTSGKFVIAAAMHAARSQHTATVLSDGTVLVAGGVGTDGAALNSAEIYNPTSDTWNVTASSLLTLRSGHTATLLPDGTVLLAGGDNSGTPLNSLELYNPADGTFAAVAGTLSSPRELHAAAALENGDVILVGGSNGAAALATTDIYSLATGTVSAGPVMSAAREGASATTQLDGKVLVAGGNTGSSNGNQDLASAEVYDPSIGAFAVTGSFATARQRHQAFLLPHNGSILIVGGTSAMSGGKAPVASVELYFPQATGQDAAANWNGTFHETGSMASARVSATGASPSDGTPQSRNDGLLLIAGGKDASGAALASGELYGFAWVKTDALDYAPGTPVTMTGGGFQPGETVTLHLQEEPYFDSHPDFVATVQSDGTFSNSEFAPDSHDVGIRFYLTVSGSASGTQAQTTFTDNNVTVASAPSGVTFTLPWTSFKGLNCGGGTNTSGSNAINSSGANIGIGNPSSIQFEAPVLSDQGGSFTNWKQGSSVLGSSSTICINNPSGTYTATYSTTAVAPTVTSVSPNAGDLGQTFTGVTLTGTGLTASTQVGFGAGITVGATTVNSANTQLSFNITIAANATLGAHNVSVTNAAGSGGGGGTATLANGFLVNPRTTTTSISCTPTSVSVGAATSCKATVTDTDSGTASTPTGNVSFASNGSGTFTPASCTLSGTGATATCALSYKPATIGTGTHSITGNYGGDSTHASSSGSFGLTVTLGTTTTVLTSSLNPSAYGQSLTFTATISTGGTPITSGSGDVVSFKDGATTLGTGTLNGSGVTTFSTSSLSLGTHTITAVFAGDSNNTASTSAPITQTINKANSATTITVSPASITSGQSATVTATVSPQYSGTPSGTVSVSDGLSGTGNTCTITLVNGTGQCSLAPSSNGSLTVTGSYGGDTNFGASSGTASLNVTGTPAAITSPTSAGFTAGSAGAFTVTATGTPTPALSETGSLPAGVTFHDNGNGTATLVGTATLAGTYPVTITAHNGVGTDATQIFTLTVNAGALASITLSPSTATIAAGGSQPYTAIGFDQFHNSRGDVTGATTFAVSNGTCTGNVCSSTAAGAQTVTGNDGGIVGGASLTVAAGPITHLALTPAMATITAGGSQTYSAIGLDAFGNAAGDVTNATTFTIGAPGSCAGASCGSTAAGNYTVAGAYGGNGAQGTAALTVTAGSFARLQLLAPGETAAPGTASGKTGTPSTEYVNGAFQVTVNAVDQYWNLANTVTDTVEITSTDAKAILPASAALIAGTGSFSVTPETVSYNPASTTVTATDTSDNAKQADTSPAIQVIIVYTAGITPVQAATGQATTYTLTVSNAAAPNTNNVKSVRIAVPANGGIPGNISVIATRPDATPANWIVDQTETGYLRVRECVTGDGCYVSGANNDIGPGGTVAVQFTTTANETVTTAPVQEVWNTTAFSDAQWTSALPLASPEPTVGIGAAPSIASAAATTFTYGAAGTFKVTANGVPTPTLTESGALPGGMNFTDDGDGTATLAGTPGAAGSYPISITAHNGYGSDAVQNFLLTVNKADQTITFAPLGNKTYGDAAFAVGASGGASGNPVTFVSSTPGICTTTGANGSTVTMVAAGMCSITASQAGNTNYNAATDVAQSFTVNQAQLAITVAGTQVYGGTDKSFTPTQYASFVNGETASVLKGTLTCTTDAANNSPAAATYNVTSCSGLSDSNYNITYVSGGFTVSPAPLSATVTGTQVYGGAGQSFTPVFSGFVLGEGPGVLTGTLVCVTNATPSSPVPGSYMVSSCSGLTDPNYKISYLGGSFTVTPAPLAITVTGTQMYGGTGKSFAPASYASFVNNEGPAVLSGALACTTNALNTSPVGNYTVAGCSGLNDANYNISYVSGGFTVTPAPLLVTASSGSMTYGGPAFLAVPLYVGFVNGETAANLTAQAACLTLATSTSPVGTYSSSCSGAADPNYTINYVAGNVLVTQATTKIALATSLSPSTYMQLVTFTATVSPQYSGTATGTVTFYDTVNGVTTSLGTGTLSIMNGEDLATLSTTGLQDQYPNSITAVYGGDTNFLNSSAAPLTQTVSPAPVVSLDPLSLSFGNQNVNTTSKGAPITLKNIGDAPLNISPNGIYISGDNATEFAETNNCGSTVAAGGSCIITITFTPADTGVATASLQIVDNDDDTVSAKQIVSLTGAGLSSIGGGSLYSDAIFATANSCGSIVLSGGSTVDSFNSSQGYNASHQLSGGNVGTNGNVTLNGSKSAIYGSADVPSLSTGNCSKTGVTGLTANGGALVTGGPVQLNGLVTYPTPPAPVPAAPTTTQSISGSCPAGLTGCSNTGSKTVSVAPGQYGNLTVGGGTTAHLQRGTYNLNSLTLSGKSILYVDSGPVVVNLAGTLSGGSPAMDVTGGSIQNPTGNPANLQFIYAGSRGMNLSGGSGSYATVYAPNALVNMNGGADFYGSIVGSTVTNSGGTAIHYDSSLADIQSGNYIWFTAVVNNLRNIGSGPVNMYLNNATINFTAGGTPYTVPVPNAVIHLNTNAATAGTSYDLANSSWITSIPAGGVTGNTFASGVGFQVPTDFPTGIQDVTFSASFTTDTPGVTLQWQWSAAVYNSSFNLSYANSGNNNLLGVNPEDGAADMHGTDAAGTPEAFKNNVVFGGTGGGLTNYTGYLSTGAGVVPTVAPLSVSPGTLSFAPQSQGTTSAAQTAVLTNNDADAHTILNLQITGSSASDFAQTNNCIGSLAPGASCSISITFAPSVIGTRTAAIVINDPANTASPVAVYLSGAGQ